VSRAVGSFILYLEKENFFFLFQAKVFWAPVDRRPSEEVVKIMSDILLMLFTFHNQHRWKKIIFNIKCACLMATTYIEGLDSLSV